MSAEKQISLGKALQRFCGHTINAYICSLIKMVEMKKTKPKHVYIFKHLPLRKDYYAICLFGFILSVRPLNMIELNHESIHAAQQKELLYIPFFIWYGIEWLILFIKHRDATKAYFRIRFEEEAYVHQADLNYLSNRKHYHYLFPDY